MNPSHPLIIGALLIHAAAAGPPDERRSVAPEGSAAVDVRQEMARAQDFGRKASALILRNQVRAYWSPDSSQLVYRLNTRAKGGEFFQVNPVSGTTSLAFDHEALAMALAKAEACEVHAENLPLEDLQGCKEEGKIRFRAFRKNWLFDSRTSALAPDDTPPGPSVSMPPNKPLPKPQGNLSPDNKWRACIRNYNLVVEPASSGGDANDSLQLSTDGSAQDPYCEPVVWSPDAKKVVCFQAKPVKNRQIHIVQSSPPDQLQPKLLTIDYPKPGDPIRQPKPRLFDITDRKQIAIDDALFNNPWEISASAWSNDSSEFSFIYNQRGHQVMRIVGIHALSGAARVIVEESSKTFINYSDKTYLHRLPATRELIWASERDGYNHLYLIDEVSGQIKSQITKGNWNVREVLEVDEQHRQTLLKTIGFDGANPYDTHFARVNFDGSGFTSLTESGGHHQIDFSPDHQWLIDTCSRVDLPPLVTLRRAADGKFLADLARADDSALRQTGWTRPERFTAKGRDGSTDIYGIIIRPSRFDPSKKYPVIEYIYAGPQDFFVPQTYMAWCNMNQVAELGFIVVSIDGMGTNWRNKAFHDVCWKNLADSGLPDRIPWIKAAAATRPWMDLARVGIFGGSAGGQSTLAALLHHGDFYKVGVADCGCHDNRMDKIWWNEAWMGWPVDESYTRNSNVVNAAKLTGKLMLVVGETDHNVDPASTTQVVAALQQAGKDFDFLPIMNSDHGAAESPYGKYRRADFLVRHLGGPLPR
ncbi:MAG: prolyl oligopeptidase family serine peptidase [Verrucomicrobiota bacterium]